MKDLQLLQGNYLIWIGIAVVVILAVAFLLVFLSGCTPNQEDVDEPGGHKDYTDTDAPKEIKSQEIISFRYEFNAAMLHHLGYEVFADYYSFSLTKAGDSAISTSWGVWAGDDVYRHELTLPLSTLADLQVIVNTHDLAQYNGVKHTTAGLPEQLGSLLRIEYASGEEIYTYNNASEVTSDQASADLFVFFTGLIEKETADN